MIIPSFSLYRLLIYEHSSHQRREERLADAIARSKDHRHDTYMRGREEAVRKLGTEEARLSAVSRRDKD